MKNEIIFFETEDKSITLPVQVSTDTVWLNRSQLAELFGLSNAERNECVEKLMSAFVTWRIEAQKAACKESEIAVMKPIFEDRLSAVKKAMLR